MPSSDGTAIRKMILERLVLESILVRLHESATIQLLRCTLLSPRVVHQIDELLKVESGQ